MNLVKVLLPKILDWFLTKEMSPVISELKLILNYIDLFTHRQADLGDSWGIRKRSP